MHKRLSKLSGWGGYPVRYNELLYPPSLAHFRFNQNKIICRGQGRSYGDAAISNGGQVIATQYDKHFIHFDENTGQLTAAAGVTLADILENFVPRGWFPSVVPGTQFVSLGGLVANDCHGKNHYHVGSFGNHIQGFKLLSPQGHYDCSPHHHTPLFYATIGGMGLTGIITQVTCRLKAISTPYLFVNQQATCNLEQTLTVLQQHSESANYCAAWLDGLSTAAHLGRGIVMSGEHVMDDDLPSYLHPPKSPQQTKSIAFTLPFKPLITPLVSAFNACYYRIKRRQSSTFSHYQPFFFPLDGIAHWNRLYGTKGFLQYQCVLPDESALEGFTTLLQQLQQYKLPVYLAVLKRLSAQSQGLLSFPSTGYTLSLDIPYSKSLINQLQRMDEYILKHGGRIYLAKDAHMQPQHFAAMYPSLTKFQSIKSQFDPNGLMQSALSQRLDISS